MKTDVRPRSSSSRKRRARERRLIVWLAVVGCAALVAPWIVWGGPRGARAQAAPAHLPRVCVVLSYDDTYLWQREIRSGIDEVLNEQAEVLYFEMDTLNRSAEFISRRGEEALEWVISHNPAAVIVADDHAMRLVAERGKSQIDSPIAFCGVNWPARDYALPRAGISGMIQRSAARQGLVLIRPLLPDRPRALLLGVARRTDQIYAAGFKREMSTEGVEVDIKLVSTFDDWCRAFVAAQDTADFIFLRSNAGLDRWDAKRAREVVWTHTRRLTLSEFSWMSDYVVLNVAKDGAEQGRWAAQEALLALSRPDYPARPLVTNRDVRCQINRALLEQTGLRLTPKLEALSEAAP